MRNEHFFLFFGLLFSSTWANAQNELQVIPTFSGVPIELTRPYSLSETDSIQFETIKFYISNITLTNGLGNDVSPAERYYLIDLANQSSQHIALPSYDQFTHITFDLGIDSITNVSGAMEGALDPTNGMYWTWQSGYINLKLEGTSSACPARNHFFQYHLGGYQFPNNALQTIQLDFSDHKYQLFLPLDNFFQSANLMDKYEVMRPCEEAVHLSVLTGSLFNTKL